MPFPLLIPDRIRKLKAEGREEGQRDLQQQWMAWYERLQTASREGQPFTEPPPAGPPSKNGK